MPLKVIVAVVPEQMVVVPEMVAVGNAFTVSVAEPDWSWLQFGLAEATLAKV